MNAQINDFYKHIILKEYEATWNSYPEKDLKLHCNDIDNITKKILKDKTKTDLIQILLNEDQKDLSQMTTDQLKKLSQRMVRE
jgi:hypothetical protein